MKLIIVDRDGVINYDIGTYVKTVDELELIPSSTEAIANLTQADYKVVICTNQAGIAKGLMTMSDLHEINEKIHKEVNRAGGRIYAIFVCPHQPEDNCECRKPKSKMIFDICARFQIDNPKTMMFVGDSERDLLAMYNAGGIPVLVKTGHGKKTLSKGELPCGTLVFDDLLAVSEYLLTSNNDQN